MGKLAWVRYQGRRIYLPRDPDIACRRKTRFDTELAARMGAQAALSVPIHAGKRRLWVYACPACAGWHFTSCDQEKGAAVTTTQLWQGVEGVPPEALPQIRRAAR